MQSKIACIAHKGPLSCGFFIAKYQFIELVDIISVLIVDGLSAHFLFVEPDNVGFECIAGAGGDADRL